MKLAVYYPWIYLHGGIERSLLELSTRSRHEWTIYTGHYQPERTFPGFAGQRVVRLQPLSVKRTIPHVLGASLRIATQQIPLDGFDAFVVWCDGLGDLATFRNHHLPTFNICSTPLRAVFDPVYAEAARQSRGQAGRLFYRLFESAFRPVDRRAWSHYDGVIATSQEVKRRIVDGKLFRDGARMRLLHPGIDARAVDGVASYQPLLLVPGRIMWTKNLGLAIDAFRRAELPDPWRLVIAGFVDDKSRDYLRALQTSAKDQPRIEFVENPRDAELRALYRSASAVLFPPLNEDWGIVPLEAMAHGKPVIANASGGPLESVLDGETGWLLRPNAADWAARLSLLAGAGEPLLRKMGQRGREHVAQYDWSRFVRGVDDAFEEWTRHSPKGRS
jgi:glycosyltransferase involved in cell wall biosynthesis